MVNKIFASLIKQIASAYAPYSHIRFVACLQTAEEKLYFGNNIENCAYGSTMCAEANVLGSFISDNNPIGTKVSLYLYSPEAIFAWPCGNCRQIIAELVHPDSLVITFNKQGETKQQLVSELLNKRFVWPTNNR